jgi:hypothetical protein
MVARFTEEQEKIFHGMPVRAEAAPPHAQPRPAAAADVLVRPPLHGYRLS